jgi:hypothetical protein
MRTPTTVDVSDLLKIEFSHLLPEGNLSNYQIKRIRTKGKENYLLEVGFIENDDEKKFLKEVSKKNLKVSMMDIHKQFRIRDDEGIWQVCNSSQAEDYNQIVYWESCGIWVHQIWYDIKEIPEDDWIWTSWEVFGGKQAQFVRWALCPNKGGAMKPTNILNCDDVLIKNGTGVSEKTYENTIMKWFQNYSNEGDIVIEEHQESKDKPESQLKTEHVIKTWKLRRKDKIKEISKANCSIFKTEDLNLTFPKVIKREIRIQMAVFGSKYKKKIKSIYGKENIQQMLLPPFYAWAHISCWIFTPGAFLNKSTLVKMSKIEMSHFEQKCYIWARYNPKSTNCDIGSTVKWSDDSWQLNFHVEWARRIGNFPSNE